LLKQFVYKAAPVREKAGGKKRKALMVLCEKAEPERAKQAKRKTKRDFNQSSKLISSVP
jgi:hypothetical protein